MAAQAEVVSFNAKCIQEASRIALLLCRDAIWSDDQCNWMNWQVLPQQDMVIERYAAAGASLYDGSAGIALFLAHVARFDDNPLIAEALEGALRGLEPRISQLQNARSGSAYSGLAGVAVALREIADMQQDDKLHAESESLFAEAVSYATDSEDIDVLAGVAGVLPLMVSRGGHYLEKAEKLAINLLGRASSSPNGLAWPTGTGGVDKPLTGFSHGAAGIAWCLAEVGVACQSTELINAARATVEYENRGYSTTHGNWLDFRDMGAHGAKDKQINAMSAWCHGAPGIGLARLRMAMLLGDEVCLDDARRAISHVVASLSTDPRMVGHSLCHGLCGNLELLIEAADWDEFSELRRTLVDVVDGTLDAIRLGHPWRGGTRSGRQTPGLMLGLSGIGYFLLRCMDSSNVPPSVMLMTRL